MPFKRRYAPKRKLIRRKKFARRPMKRSMTGPAQPVQFFKRTDYVEGWASVGTTAPGVAGAYNFALTQVPNASDFTALYDQYKINLVKFTIIPRGNTSNIVTGGNSMGVFTVLDYDDSTVPANLDTLLQHQNMKMTRSVQQHKRVFRPLVRDQLIGSGGAASRGQYRGWIDCDDTTIPHFGIKYWFQASPSGTQEYDLKVDYYLAFKNVR